MPFGATENGGTTILSNVGSVTWFGAAGLALEGRLVSTLDAHRAGLQVVAWTFRPENAFLAADFRNGDGPNARNEAGSIAEMRRYLDTGIDGLFSDDTALARKAISG